MGGARENGDSTDGIPRGRPRFHAGARGMFEGNGSK
jgi:hypothetical protein